MSRFTDAERDRIRTQLIEAGRELFAQFGFERTRIKDITDAVDIGTSTFYQFFDSKETLYVEVLCVERDELETQIDTAVSAVGTPREEVRTMLETMFREVHTNPLISRLIVDNELHALQDQLSPADQEELAASLQQSGLSYADQWIDVAGFRIEDPAVVRGLIRSLVFTTRSRETLVEAGDTASYDAVEAALIDAIVDGLFVN